MRLLSWLCLLAQLEFWSRGKPLGTAIDSMDRGPLLFKKNVMELPHIRSFVLSTDRFHVLSS